MNVTATEKRPVSPPKKKPLAVVLERLSALRLRLSALRPHLAVLARYTRDHLRFLGRLPAWQFIPAVGLWMVVLKMILVPFAALLSGLLFRPLGIGSLFATPPVQALSDSLTTNLYEVSFLSLRWSTLSTLSQLILAALLLPVLSTLLAQLVPLEALANAVRSQRWRMRLSLAVVGLLYLLSWGEPAFLVTGAVIALPLAHTFLHWRRRSSLTGACLVTCGVHALANAVVVLSRGFFAGGAS